MRILMSGMSGNRGGKETYIYGMAQQLVLHGVDIDFLTTDNPMAYEDEAKDLGCHVWHVPQRSAGPSAHVRAIEKVLNENSYDVIWSHKTTLSSTEDLIAAKKYAVPIRIIHSHCTENLGTLFTAVMHAMHRCSIGRVATHFFACSDAAGKYFYPKRLSFGVKKNAFDLEKYAPNDEVRESYREKMGLQDKLVVGHAGRLSPEKNHTKLLDVFYGISTVRPDAVLLLCGVGELKEAISRQAQELGIEDKVVFLGARDDIPSLLQAFDLFVFPSYHEGLPYAPLEAQAAGVPCVMSTAVSQEAQYSSNAVRLSIDALSTEWAAQCLELYERERESAIPMMRENGLDIAVEAAKMFSFLNDCVKG